MAGGVPNPEEEFGSGTLHANAEIGVPRVVGGGVPTPEEEFGSGTLHANAEIGVPRVVAGGVPPPEQAGSETLPATNTMARDGL